MKYAYCLSVSLVVLLCFLCFPSQGAQQNIETEILVDGTLHDHEGDDPYTSHSDDGHGKNQNQPFCDEDPDVDQGPLGFQNSFARGRKLGGMPTGVVIPNDYLHPKRRELLCEGLEPREGCVTNSTELRMSIEFCKESEVCEPGEVWIMIPASTNIELEQEMVIRQGLIVHINSYEGEITISGTKQNRLFRVSGTLYANRVTFKDGYSNTHGGAIHLAHGDAYAYINHCAFIGNDAADGGSVVWNEGVLHMSNSLFSPAHSTIAPIYNDGILHMHPLQEIDDDTIVPVRI